MLLQATPMKVMKMHEKGKQAQWMWRVPQEFLLQYWR